MDSLALAVMAINSQAARMWLDLIIKANGFVLTIHGKTLTIDSPDSW